MDELTAGMVAQIHEVEQKDENQVMAELAGETVQEYVYETEVWDWVTGGDGKRHKRKVRKVNLSWVGTREVARNRGNIILDTPDITETEDSWRFVVRATDLLRNFTVFGGCHQLKQMKVNDIGDGGVITGSHLETDDYSFQKGLSKSQRNALKLCIPGEYAARMIDRFLRASGKTPLLANTGRPAVASRGHRQSPPKTGPTAADIKPREEWDKITQEQVPDYPHLETIMWNLCKLQPKDMYIELGGGSRNEMTVAAWQSFLALKERYSPIKP